MSEKISPTTGIKYGIELVCDAWKFPRSSFYHKAKEKVAKRKRGKPPTVSDEDIRRAIEKDIEQSPFKGEGHRKIHARISKKMVAGRNRVLKIMKEHSLLSPHRYRQKKEKLHDGRITTDHPGVMWATDASKIFTLEDGWVWFFGVIEHWNAECLGWHLTKKGDRFAAIEAMTQALERIFGNAQGGVARGLSLRVDHGTQFLSEGFVNQVRYWGIALSKGFVKEPETNGVVERFHRTFKEQVVHGRHYHGLADLKHAVNAFIESYNEFWQLEKLNYHSPNEARRLYVGGRNVLKPPKKILSELAEQGREHGYFVLATSNT